METPSQGGPIGYLRRRAEGIWRRIWPLNFKRAAVLFVILFGLLFITLEARSTDVISVQVVIISRTDFVAFNPTTERLDFGDMSRGSAQTRHLTLENNGSLPTRVSIILMGEVRDFISMSDAFFTLDPGEIRQVDFTLNVPAAVEVKSYSGRVVIVRTPWIPLP